MISGRTSGRQLLLVVIARSSAREVAARCRVHESRVSQWASGVTRPSAPARCTLAIVYGILPASWVAPPTRVAAPLTLTHA